MTLGAPQWIVSLCPSLFPTAVEAGAATAADAAADSSGPTPPPILENPSPALDAVPAVRLQRASAGSNAIASLAVASALLCSGCDGREVGTILADFFNHISPPTAALIGALFGSLIGPLARVIFDVRFRATTAGTRQAAVGDLNRTIETLQAVETLPQDKIRRQFLRDLVETEKEAIRSKKAAPILGRADEIRAIFNAFLEIEPPSLVITGDPNSGTSTLIRAVAREVAKRELGQASLCPPAWKGGRLYTLRFERLMALDEDHRKLMLMAILRISKDDPQHVKLVIDNRPFLAGDHISTVMAPILDAIQRSRIGVVLAMTEGHLEKLTTNGGTELKAHLRPVKLGPLPEEDMGRIVTRAFLDQIAYFKSKDPAFARFRISIPSAWGDSVLFRALAGSDDGGNADLGEALAVARQFAVYLYREYLEDRLTSGADGLVLDEERARRFRQARREPLP